MKQIIRVEHPDSGLGLFQYTSTVEFFHEKGLDELLSRHNLLFPSPWMDKELRSIERDEYCAFKSIEQIQKWIAPDEFNIISSIGFKIYLLDVSECREGQEQSLYRKCNILQQKDITSLFVK
jgi:hypothetical protein